MACFLVPVGEAVVTTIVQKVVANKEKKAGEAKQRGIGLKWSRRLGWLNKMLWGGSILLALEHVWHGEIVPWPPFLTAVSTGEVASMLHEMMTIGGAMAAGITVIWAIIIAVVELRTKAKVLPAVKGSPISGGQ